MKASNQLKTLGKSRAKFTGIETFPKPKECVNVKLISDEVTANCPVTGQPDFYTVEIEYSPDQLCAESKTVKLYLQSFRDTGMFCEAFANKICTDFNTALNPHRISVKVIQKPRGGVSIVSTSFRKRPFNVEKAIGEFEQKLKALSQKKK